MVGYQNADSGIALAAGANKLLPFGRKCARGGERHDGFGNIWRLQLEGLGVKKEMASARHGTP